MDLWASVRLIVYLSLCGGALILAEFLGQHAAAMCLA